MGIVARSLFDNFFWFEAWNSSHACACDGKNDTSIGAVKDTVSGSGIDSLELCNTSI